MNIKKLIFSYVVQTLSVAALFIMLMPIVGVGTETMSAFEAVSQTGNWVFFQDYLFGIAGLISVICLPLLIISTELCKLSACGVIKCKKLDLALYIINIVLASIVVATIVNYFLGLGRTIGMSGLQLFKGPTWFQYATAFFYLHCVISVAMLVIAILNRNWKKK